MRTPTRTTVVTSPPCSPVVRCSRRRESEPAVQLAERFDVELQHTFTVPAPIEQAWATLLDVEGIAPCFPGAALTGVDGDEFSGTVKVKLGPVSLQYAGKGRFVERDEAARRVLLEANGSDKRGNGTAGATGQAPGGAARADEAPGRVDTRPQEDRRAPRLGRGGAG